MVPLPLSIRRMQEAEGEGIAVLAVNLEAGSVVPGVKVASVVEEEAEDEGYAQKRGIRSCCSSTCLRFRRNTVG